MDEDDASLDQVVNTFLETAEQVAINTEVVQRPRKQRARRHPLRRATIRAIHRRQELARAQPCDEAALEEARQEAKRMVRADQHADWVTRQWRFIKSAAHQATHKSLFRATCMTTSLSQEDISQTSEDS